MKKSKLFVSSKTIIAAGLLFLAACQTDGDIGTGPIELTARQSAHFQRYLSENTNEKYFLVSEDHTYTYFYYCTEIAGCELVGPEAVYECERKSGKVC